jgi:hypothetical protein
MKNASIVRFEIAGVLLFLGVFAACLFFSSPDVNPIRKQNADGTVTERVKQVIWRTEKPHDGCPSNGFLRAVPGQPERITAYGIDKFIWTHVCSGCGETNRIYDACWPKFRTEWEVSK